MTWRTDMAAMWDREAHTFAMQLRHASPGGFEGNQALDLFSAGHHVAFSGSRESRGKKATDLLAALAPVPSSQLRGMLSPSSPDIRRSPAAQKVVHALHELVNGSDPLVQMHTAAQHMQGALARGSHESVADALQAWRLCLATAKCQSSEPTLRKVQTAFLESTLAYCVHRGMLLAELAGEVEELTLAARYPLNALSRAAAQQLPALALALLVNQHSNAEDGFATSKVVWSAASRLIWDHASWFAEAPVHTTCREVSRRLCNAWVAAGGKLADPDAPAVLTAEDLQPFSRALVGTASVASAPNSSRVVEPVPDQHIPQINDSTALRTEAPASEPAAAPSDVAFRVQLSSHLVAPPKEGLADHLGVPEELHGLVRLTKLRPNQALLPHSMLFFGPPGCGKTSLARRLAFDLKLPLYAFSGAELMSVYQGGPGLRVQNLFAQLREEAKQQPQGIILFLDEAGRLLNDRTTSGTSRDDEGATESFLYEVQDDDVRNAKILVICATNHRERIDAAVASRLLQFALKPLDVAKRAELFLGELEGYGHEISLDAATNFIKTCPDLAGRDIAKLLVRAQLLAACRDNATSLALTIADLKQAWQKMQEGSSLK